MSTLELPDSLEILDLRTIRLRGFSVSSIATYIAMDGLDAVFDMGHCHPAMVSKNNVLLTHTHMDHVGGLPHFLSRRAIRGMGKTTVYVPEASKDSLRKFLFGAAAVDGASQGDLEEVCEVVGINPGDYIKVGRYLIQAIPAHHVLPSVGYMVFEDRKRRDPVTRADSVVRFPLLGFIGDSTTKAITEQTAQAQTLVIECTFVAENEKLLAEVHGHTHLDDLVDLMQKQPELFVGNDVIVIKHQSLRHKRDEFRKQILAKIPDEFLPRISFITASV
jgi:ribonuclease Z